MKLNVKKNVTLITIGVQVVIAAFIPLLFLEVAQRAFSGSDQLSHISKWAPIYIIISVGMYGLYRITHEILVRRNLKKRQKILLQRCSELDMSTGQIKPPLSLQYISEDRKKYKDHQTTNSFVSSDWGYSEYQFSYSNNTKEVASYYVTYYFAIAAFKLPRKLPNIFFDSRKTGGKEFKLLFDATQVHSMESTFDSYFTTYFHDSYRIDSLSIISPEVMEVIMSAQEYDIEIFQDTLYLFSELRDMPLQIDDMQEKGKLIRTKLLNNIVTYRDEQLEYKDGRRTVSLLGLELKRSLTTYYTRFTLSTLMIVVLVGVYTWSVVANFQVGGLLYWCLFVFAISTMVRNYRIIMQIKNEQAHVKTKKYLGA